MEKPNESDLDLLDETQEETSPLECLVKTQDCKSTACEQYTTCSGNLKSHCYAMADHLSKEIILAGCWSGGIECHSPSEMLAHLKKKVNSLTGDDEFKKKALNIQISNELLQPDIQNKCISFAEAKNDYSFRSRYNQSSCCCATSRCNSNIHFTSERNPVEVFTYPTPVAAFKSTTSTSSLVYSNKIKGQEIGKQHNTFILIDYLSLKFD